MSIPRRAVYALSILTIAALGVSCNDSPTRPTPPSGGTTGGTTTVSPTVRLEISAPASIAPGTSTQLTATAVKADGSREDVTKQAVWTTGNPQVIDFGPEGLARGRQRGEAFIQARHANRFANTRVMVLPDGTFKLTGTVNDIGVGLEGATVLVFEGTGEGLTVTTDANGFYALYGVAGAIRLQVKKDGYLNAIEELQVAANRIANISMTIAGARRQLAGTYDLTLTVNGSCTGLPFPAAARTRTYTAEITQTGNRLSVALSGADFIVTQGYGNRFDGVVIADAITFYLGDDYYYYYVGQYAVIERFAPTALLINGRATATQTPTGISGRLNGSMGMARSATSPHFPPTATCISQQHGFEMRRR